MRHIQQYKQSYNSKQTHSHVIKEIIQDNNNCKSHEKKIQIKSNLLKLLRKQDKILKTSDFSRKTELFPYTSS